MNSLAKHLTARFRIKPGKRAHLAGRDPADHAAFPDRKAAEEQSTENANAINELQDRLYAEGKRALLVVLQGTDTAGKDGTIRHVFNATGPLGVTVTAFGRPSEEELAHDFLWRAHLACPAPRLHRHLQPLALRGRAGRPRAQACARKRRSRRATARSTPSRKSWPRTAPRPEIHAAHLQERAGASACRSGSTSKEPLEVQPRRPRGPQALGQVHGGLRADARPCSTPWAPWHVIPADRKWARNAAIAAIVRADAGDMDPQYPKPPWNPKDFKVV